MKTEREETYPIGTKLKPIKPLKEWEIPGKVISHHKNLVGHWGTTYLLDNYVRYWEWQLELDEDRE